VSYDPLIAKVVCYGETRAAALARAREALRNFPILGIRTNLPFLNALLADARVERGAFHTRFVDEHATDFVDSAEAPPEAFAAAAVAAAPAASTPSQSRPAETADPWATAGRWGR
jgi:acetyl/propionyl-CoA carboxylase alpha subunit